MLESYIMRSRNRKISNRVIALDKRIKTLKEAVDKVDFRKLSLSEKKIALTYYGKLLNEVFSLSQSVIIMSESVDERLEYRILGMLKEIKDMSRRKDRSAFRRLFEELAQDEGLREQDDEIAVEDEEIEVDLSLIEPKLLDESDFTKGHNSFNFTLPSTNTEITFKLLTHKDEMSITRELEGLKKISKTNSPIISTKLKYTITSVEGDSEPKTIRKYVDDFLLARDARALRKHIDEFQPDIDLSFFPPESDTPQPLPIGLNFFWPDVKSSV